ncbi:unnamed protein product [Brugia timori]|uniref:Uncharacterized protein n=1 Tax=Brugia timori TaxID=42155 RepID=A0A3P7UW52_9BILA|nr:unnamed protein product [Brugia timori]
MFLSSSQSPRFIGSFDLIITGKSVFLRDGGKDIVTSKQVLSLSQSSPRYVDAIV